MSHLPAPRPTFGDAFRCHEGRVVRLDATGQAACVTVIVAGREVRKQWLSNEEFVRLCGYKEPVEALQEPVSLSALRSRRGPLEGP
jgi:hypothetical protein